MSSITTGVANARELRNGDVREPQPQATRPAHHRHARHRQDNGDPTDCQRARPQGAARGFYTEEIREDGERRGFRLVRFDGTAHIIAHVDFPKRHRVGKYGVDVPVLDEAAQLLRPDPHARVYLVDEIGKMECLSDRFMSAIRVLISGYTPMVATVGAYGGGFIAEVKRRPECELWEVTHANCYDLPARILAWLAERS